MTTYQTIQIHPAAAAKPPVGAACNGCGVCCAMEPCPVGVLLSGRRTGACKALLWSDDAGRYECGVVTAPRQHIAPRWLAGMAGRLAMRLIAAGQGCDCDVEVSSPH